MTETLSYKSDDTFFLEKKNNFITIHILIEWFLNQERYKVVEYKTSHLNSEIS